MGNLSQHFDTDEPKVACSCGCGFGGKVDDTDPRLWEALEDLRAHFGGKPVTINSCCRCKAYNRSVGSSDTSQHCNGTAADLVVSGVSPTQVANYFEATFPNAHGIGRYSTFTHFDTRRNKARWNG